MAYGIGDLVDFERILPLMRAFYDLTGIPSTITTLDGTLCRCGTQLRILRAVKRAAELLATEGG